MIVCLSATRWRPAVLISGSLPIIVLSFLVCFCACLFVCLAPQGRVGGVAESISSVYYLVAPHKKPVFVFSLIDWLYVCLLVCLFVCLSATGWSRTVRGGGWERAYYSVAPYKEPVFVPHIHRWQGLGHCGGEHQPPIGTFVKLSNEATARDEKIADGWTDIVSSESFDLDGCYFAKTCISFRWKLQEL